MSETGTVDTVVGREMDELHRWLEASWDPDLTVGEWWDRLGLAGWAQPLLPRDAYGRGLSFGDAQAVLRAVERFGALGPPTGLGLLLAAPTIAAHGTPEQIERFVPDIVTGRAAWCQLFSEPGAGSDLAGLATRAVRDGDTWVVSGQKVWTSGAQIADMGMLLARTNPDVPKHRGITWFAIDMRQAGIEVRPLKEMTGSSLFNEVFLTDAVVADDARIGDVDDGWRVANTTLMFERTGMGAGGSARGAPPARPGRVAGELDRRAGDVAPMRAARTDGPTATARLSPAADLIALARARGRAHDPLVRDALVRLHTLGELARLNTLRLRAARAAGHDVPGTPNFTKLAMADALRLRRDLGLTLLGADGMLHAYPDDDRSTLAVAPGECQAVTQQALGAQALPIFGGTDQIQRNIVAERVLGLPKEPGDLSQVPFSQLPRSG